MTVTAADDVDAVNDTATIAHAVTGADYATVTAASVTVTVADNDTATVVVQTIQHALCNNQASKIIVLGRNRRDQSGGRERLLEG